jgi:signal transduction histidine kinase
MYRRLIILSVIILAAFCGLGWLGYHAVETWAQGLQGERLGEFAAVAEQIRQDVKRRLDEFVQTEQDRPYTDYQYYYVPENIAPGQQEMPLVRSPLASQLYNDFAYGNFQIDSDGTIVTPYYREDAQQGPSDQIGRQDELAQKIELHLSNIEQNVVPLLNISAGRLSLPSTRLHYETKQPSLDSIQTDLKKIRASKKADTKQVAQGKGSRAKEYLIESLQKESQTARIVTQQRSLVGANTAQSLQSVRDQMAPADVTRQLADNRAPQPNQLLQTEAGADDVYRRTMQRPSSVLAELSPTQPQRAPEMVQAQEEVQTRSRQTDSQPQAGRAEMVQIRIEPFLPLVVPRENAEQSIFGGQVFLLRRVQIEDKHFLQGFQLNEEKLIQQVQESAERFMGPAMTFELAQGQPVHETSDHANRAVTHTAILDFAGLGSLILNLIETDPDRIGKQMNELRTWYFGIIAIVFLAVTLGLASLWHNARAQLRLAEKKDDFISAVSHELRTPLTSIRMYSEMLEKNWVKSKDKLTEYYRNMRQESERLSRLVENILDFSRIQKGRKKYTFSVGDINECIAEVVEMMAPYATENGFCIETDFGSLGQSTFDKDAVTQIVVNLLDNAIKYARGAEDKTITVRTKSERQLTVIEVEDHGPGIPHRQHKKVFEQFYRSGSETTRETNGTGLGLALVKRFAEAHNGFVEVIGAKPTGAIFRVGLPTHT